MQKLKADVAKQCSLNEIGWAVFVLQMPKLNLTLGYHDNGRAKSKRVREASGHPKDITIFSTT